MPWHPPYYQQRCEEAGLGKAMDLLMWELDISDRDHMLPIIFTLAEQLEERHGVRPAQDVAALAAQGHGSLRRGLQRGLERELGLLAVLEGGPRRTTRRRCSSSSTRTGSWSPRPRRARRWRSRSPSPTSTRCCKKMNGRLLPLGWWHFLRKQQDRSTACASASSASSPSYQHTGRRRGALRRALRHGDRDAADVGRDGLDPRDQQGHEPRDGGDARPDRAALPRLRAVLERRPNTDL